MRTNRVVVAVDPGASGGFATNTSCISCKPMPKSRTDIVEFFCELKMVHGDDVTVVMEDVPKFLAGMKTSASSMATLHSNVGYIQGVVDTLGFQLILVKPQVWQKAIEAGEKKSYGNRWKAHLKDMALRRFPYLGKAVTLKTADALLILAYVIDQQPRSNNDSP